MISSFGKVATILAIALLVGMGMCGLSYALPSSDSEFHTNAVGGISLVVMAVSLLGLIATLFAWAISGVADAVARRGEGPQKLLDHDETKRENNDR